MHISKLLLRNFRNFKTATFEFEAGVNTLIGENGAGKTNAFEAIRLLIDANLPKNASDLEESDFNRAIGDWRGHWIIVSIEFDQLDSSEACQVLAYGTEHMQQGRENRGRYTMYFRPKKHIRKQLHNLSGDTERIDQFLSEITIDHYETVYSCRGTAAIADEDFYRDFVGDFISAQFPDPDIEQKDVYGDIVPIQFSLLREVSCTYVKALRDVVSDLRTARTNPLLRLLKSQSNELKQYSHITDKIKDLNTDIAGLGEIQDLSNGIKKSITNTVGTTYAPRIDIKSELPDEMDKLLYSLTLWVGDTNDGTYQGKVRELSLGGANLIYLSLKLLEYEYNQNQDKAAHFLLIEEPEAHIHTHIQKTLFERYGYRNTQVLISTHSTHISAASRISSVNIVAKGNQEAHVYQPSKNLTSEQCKRIERYLDAVRSTLLFAKGVILVEGDAELILVPAMVKAAFGISLDEIGISLINMSSTVFANIATIFHDDRIRRKCAIITDLDTSITPLGGDERQDSEYEKKCRNSQKKGLERQVLLNDFCQGNQWVNPFYADYTFEVDFLASDNSDIIKRCIEEIYSRESDRTSSKTLIQDPSVAVSGKEVLRLAEKEGKGWLALRIAEKLNYKVMIPDYVLRAIAFVGNHITDTDWETIALYRMEQGTKAEDHQFIELKNAVTNDQGAFVVENAEFLEQYRKHLPNDLMVAFWNLCGEMTHA